VTTASSPHAHRGGFMSRLLLGGVEGARTLRHWGVGRGPSQECRLWTTPGERRGRSREILTRLGGRSLPPRIQLRRTEWIGAAYSPRRRRWCWLNTAGRPGRNLRSGGGAGHRQNLAAPPRAQFQDTHGANCAGPGDAGKRTAGLLVRSTSPPDAP
jgi:hypothetical protein